MKKILIIFACLVFPANSLACDEMPDTIEISSLYPAPLEGEEEWIELHNYGDSEINLSHFTLEDETETPWELSGTLYPNEYKQINELPFQLNNGGDTVTLKRSNGESIDSFSYSESEAGKTLNNKVGTTENEEHDDEEELNTIETPSLFPIFSEALPNPEGSDSSDEWIELFNPHQESITLNGLQLDDIEGGSSSHDLEGTMEPDTYLLISIEDSGLTLNNSTDSIRLLGTEDELLWEVEYENPEEGHSYAHFSGNYEWTDQPSPGNENIPGSENSGVPNGDLSENLEITEIFPDPEGPDQDSEWVELTNGGEESVNLSNWELDDGAGGSDPYIFPEDTILEPGETLIIERSMSKIALNNSDEKIQLVDFTGEIMDEIHYESSVEGKSYSKIEVEEIKSLQASTSGLGTKQFSTWQWVQPSPGVENPRLKQFEGEVMSFENGILKLFDGYSTWEFKVKEDVLNDLIFQIGNMILIQAMQGNSLQEIVYSELIEGITPEETQKTPWALITFGMLSFIYLAYEAYKKGVKKHLEPVVSFKV